MISEFCLPCIREALKPFGRGFLHLCGSTGTVYFGHLDPLPSETLEECLERIADLALWSDAKGILVAPPVEDRERKRLLCGPLAQANGAAASLLNR